MKRLLLAAGVAALAIAAPATAERGGGNKGGQAAKAERGGGGGHKAEHAGGGGQKANRGGGQAAKADRGQFAAGRQKPQQRDNDLRLRGRDRQEQMAKADKGVGRLAEASAKAANKQMRQAQRDDQRLARSAGRGINPFPINDFDEDDVWVQRFANGVGGCPPGHSKVPGVCMPYGQYKKIPGSVLPARYSNSLVPGFLQDIYRDDDDYYYRYGDGFIYQVDRDRNLIESLIPLFGGGLMLGQQFPAAYSNFAFPSYYQPFYQDTADDYYRYANGYAYEIDRDTGLIENIIPLLDRGYGVGQMLPASYGYYNLPYPYRDMYADSGDYYYRYAPGAIYQVDRKTQLISSIASLLTGGTGLSVGQQLPMGYDAYNLPYSYRDRYYDSADNWYRYNNGYIYQVDPTTRLITAVIDAIV